jgi:UDP-N-acetylglucosamine:LPS N-acetylglucosamine transferase
MYYSHFRYRVCYNLNEKLKVCKSVHHRTIQINHQPDATNIQFIILTFIYSSTCFGRFPTHYQEFNDCSGSLWYYLRIVVRVVLCSWSSRQAGWTDHEHNTTVTTIRRQRQGLPLQLLSSWWWVRKRLKPIEL